jgi:hypothetical protein
MVTLVFSYFVVAYLLVPSSLFRWFASLFITLKNFQRTKTQEMTFAVGAALFPLILSLLVAWSGWVPHPIAVSGTFADRRNDYETVYSGIVDEKNSSSRAFWSAVTRVSRRQVDFLFFFYYPLVLIEAGLFALLVYKYGEWKGNWFYRYIARKIILRHLSEWTMLLTPFNFPPKPAREVWLDVLTVDDVLYRGLLGQFFLDVNGVLTGLALAPFPDLTSEELSASDLEREHSPKRFDRERYKRAEEVHSYSTDAHNYWRDIPSGAFYLPAEKILNLNVTYVEKQQSDTLAEATRELQMQSFDFTVESWTDTGEAST